MTSNLDFPPETIFLTDGGLETELVFHDEMELPDFASFPLLGSVEGRAVLRRYYEAYISVARRDRTGILLETPTWRANPDWGTRLGYRQDELDRFNRQAIEFVKALQTKHAEVGHAIVVSGNIGPRGDGYVVSDAMSADAAATYHRPQIRAFAAAGTDAISALTMTYAEEAIGIVTEAVGVAVPVVISFTVETDGVLPSGQPLAAAIEEVDEATDGAASYFMVNCAHPTHFLDVLSAQGPWHRIRGIRANASKMSHAELDEATELDRGDESDLAQHYVALRRALPNLAVVGGCCGTDVMHIDAISSALVATVAA